MTEEVLRERPARLAELTSLYISKAIFMRQGMDEKGAERRMWAEFRQAKEAK